MINQQDIDNIPQQLKSYPHWVCYRLENHGKPKLDKVPYDPKKPGKKAKVNDPSTWGSFDQALEAAKNPKCKYDGIGFVFSDDDPFTGIDLDHCVKDGVILPWAQKIIDETNSYSELSPSLTGVHIYTEAIKPKGRCRKGDIEIYVSGRFLTVTGKKLPDTPKTIEKRQDEISKIHAKISENPSSSSRPADNTDHKHTVMSLSDAELIDKAISAKDGAKFKVLWNGDTSGYGDDDSRADMALCGMLAFWTGKDHNRIDSLFRQSGLMRDKWNERHGEQTYGDMTISKAIEGCVEVYKGKGRGNVLPGPGTRKRTTSEQAIQNTDNDESWKCIVDQLKAKIDPVEAGRQVRYFVLTKLLHYDEMTVNRIVKGPLKKEFSLDASEIKGLLKTWKEEKSQKETESKALKNAEEELNHYISNPVFEKDGRIWKIKIKERFGEKIHEEVPITTFTIEPIESITIKGEGETLNVNLKAGYKEFKKVLLSPGCWSSTQKFMNVLPGKETVFAGSTVDVQYIRFLMSTFEMAHKIGIRTSGFHDGKFVTEEGALSIQGISDGIVYFNEVPTNCKLLSVEPATADELSVIKKHIANFNTPTVSLPILGWITACFLKSIISETLDGIGLSNGFPLLNIQGEAGAGKTQSAEAVIMRMWAIQGEPKSIGELTKFTLMKVVGGSNTIPVILEENKSCMQTDYFQNLISNLIRSIYNCLEGERGRADQSTQVYRYQAPVVIVGETGFTEGALLDRFVTVFLSKKDSSPYLQNFKELRKQPLEKLGRSILEKALRMGREEVKSILEEELEAVDSDLADRPRTNASIVRFGLRILSDVLGMQFDLSKVDAAVKEGIREGDSTNRKSSVDKILEAMCLMCEFQTKTIGTREGEQYSYQDHLEKDVDYDIIYEPGVSVLRLYVHGAYPKFLKWAKSYRFEGDLLPESTFKKQLQRESYYMNSNKPVRIGQNVRKAFELNIDKMAIKGLELSEFWSYEGEILPF
jgi:primase-polymerase (primpol)-like protein